MKLPNKGSAGGRPVVVIDTYSQVVRGELDVDAADAALQVISCIADDLDDWAAGMRHRGFIRRQARRLREHVAKVDAALGLKDRQ